MRKLFLILFFIPFFGSSQTPTFCCGFECGVNAGGTSHFGSVGTTGFSTSVKRSGDRSYRLYPTTQASSYFFLQTVVESATVLVMRYYVYIETMPNFNLGIHTLLLAGSSTYYGIGLKSSDSKLYFAYFNGLSSPFNFGSSSYSVTTGVWYLIDFRVDVSSNPWKFDIKVNGTSFTQETVSSAATTVSQLYLGHNHQSSLTTEVFYDDFLLSKTSGDYPLGAGYINHFIPTSDGTHNIPGTGTFRRGTTATDILNTTTDAYLLIDDIPSEASTPATNDYIGYIPNATNNLTRYVECVYGAAPGISTPTTNAPRAVEVFVSYHQAGTGATQWEIKLNDNGTENTIFACNGCAGVTTTRYSTKQYATMVGGGAWTVSRFNNLRVRYGYSDDGNPDHYFSSTMIEAEFPPDELTVPGTPSDKQFTNLGVGNIFFKPLKFFKPFKFW